MDEEDKEAIDDFVEVLNRKGRPAFEYLKELLAKEENEEALAWLCDVQAED